MKALTWLIVFVWPVLVAGAGDGKQNGQGVGKQSTSSRPQVRTFEVRAGSLAFKVTLKPGVPMPGRVVEVLLEASEIPPVPDPVYGERIPLKGLDFVARITDSDGEGFTSLHRVHQLDDVGKYGFHVTPLRKDVLRVELVGSHRGNGFKARFALAVDTWPLPPRLSAGQGAADRVPGGRLPALPAGMKPAVPAGASLPAGGTPGASSLMRRIMRELGRAYSKLGAAVWLTRRVVWMDAAAAAKEMSDALQRSSVRDVSMESVAEALKDVASAIEGRNRGSVKKAFASLSERCVDCHLEKRWNLR